jgi:type IV pilus assembly protein PilV
MRGSGGFTLVEVLVALFVAALGIAGAAGLQTLALRSAQEAARLSDGTRLASTLAERMRANPPAMALPDAGNPYLQLDYDTSAGPPAPVAPCFADDACDALQFARFDLFEVSQALAARFPGGRILVCRDAVPAVRWGCASGAGAPMVAKLGWSDGAADTGGRLPKLLLTLPGAAP